MTERIPIISSDPRGASFNGALAYTLDGAGNRLSRTSTLATLGAQSFTYSANDEISGDTFDANGNTTSSGGHTFAYDFENRLASKDSGAITLTHDCDGNRVAKTVSGVTTRYLVDDLNPTGYLQVLEEVVGGAVQTRFTYGTSIVSQTRDVSGTPATSYYGYDVHGNITFLTNTAGNVVASYDYDAWGNVVANTGTTQNTRRYVGEELDTDLGFLNLRARQYTSSTGRFITIDPASGALGKLLSFNRYLYTSVDPTDAIDPLGQNEYYEDYQVSTGPTARTLTPNLRAQLKITIKHHHAWGSNTEKHLLLNSQMTEKELDEAIRFAAREMVETGAQKIVPGTGFESMVAVPIEGYALVYRAFFVTATWMEIATYFLRP